MQLRRNCELSYSAYQIPVLSTSAHYNSSYLTIDLPSTSLKDWMHIFEKIRWVEYNFYVGFPQELPFLTSMSSRAPMWHPPVATQNDWIQDIVALDILIMI